jgi:hypothetical protein
VRAVTSEAVGEGWIDVEVPARALDAMAAATIDREIGAETW